MRGGNHKWYALILAILGVALIVDRLFFATGEQPQSAEAALEDFAKPVDAQSKPIELLTVVVTPFPDVSSENLSAVRDPFTMSPLVQNKLMAELEESDAQVTESSKAALTAEQFEVNHQLSAVIKVDGQWRAVINGVLMAPGQRIDGCVIIGINERSVEAQCGRKKIRLIIQEPLDRK